FLKAAENADRAADDKKANDREFYLRMERKWLGLADGIRWIADLERHGWRDGAAPASQRDFRLPALRIGRGAPACGARMIRTLLDRDLVWPPAISRLDFLCAATANLACKKTREEAMRGRTISRRDILRGASAFVAGTAATRVLA